MSRTVFPATHERHDGSGFPEKLMGDQIPLEARVISVAEVYVSLTASAKNRNALTPGEAVEELKSRTGKFNPDILTALEDALGSALTAPLS